MGFRTVRKIPTWAIILGIIGLFFFFFFFFFFFIGIVFFFVKETRQEEARILTLTLDDGRSFSGPFVDGASFK